MGRILGMLFVLIVLLMGLTDALFAQDTQWQNLSHEIRQGYCVKLDPAQPQTIYFGTPSGLYKTDDAGLHWTNILHESSLAINDIFIDLADTQRVYAASSKGIFLSSDAGITWKSVLRTLNGSEIICSAIVAAGGAVYAGTDQGLIVSSDKGSHWHKESGSLSKNNILSISVDTSDEGFIYVAAGDGVYRRKIIKGQWERAFVIKVEEDQNLEGQLPAARYICVDPGKTGSVYLAIARGVLFSADSALTWQNVSQEGLLSKDVRCLSIGPGSRVFASTNNELFDYENGRWRHASAGFTANIIRGIAADANFLYAACDEGLYRKSQTLSQSDTGHNQRNSYIKDMPLISSVQKAAIQYADVDMNKIMQWRAQARHKALLPSVGFGFNKNTSDLWHWEGGSTTKDYDDILRKGKASYEWDVDFSWDFGDLIWNESQTSIDTRARLLVQLRQDILDEVTKLYFEYARVRVEMDSLSLMDRKKLVEKDIRLQELAASLDGLTNGFFSKNIN
jgi:hypothetical protein